MFQNSSHHLHSSGRLIIVWILESANIWQEFCGNVMYLTTINNKFDGTQCFDSMMNKASLILGISEWFNSVHWFNWWLRKCHLPSHLTLSFGHINNNRLSFDKKYSINYHGQNKNHGELVNGDKNSVETRHLSLNSSF